MILLASPVGAALRGRPHRSLMRGWGRPRSAAPTVIQARPEGFTTKLNFRGAVL